MRVQFKKNAACPDYVARRGEVLDLPEDEAVRLEKAGAVELLDPPKRRRGSKAPAE